MRQDPRLLQHEPRAPREVLQRRLAAERPQLVARRPIPELRLVAEREERLVASRRRARPRDVEHLLLRHVRALAPPRRSRERAVVADVPAELRQRDEDLRRVGDERTVAHLAQPAGLLGELLPGCSEQSLCLHGASLEPWYYRTRKRPPNATQWPLW